MKLPHVSHASGPFMLNPERPPDIDGGMVNNLWQFASPNMEQDEDLQLPLYTLDTQEGFVNLSDPGDQVIATKAWLRASVLDAGRLRRGRPPKSIRNFAPRPFSPGIRAPPPIFISGLPKTGKSYWLKFILPTILGEDRRVGLKAQNEFLVLLLEGSDFSYEDSAGPMLWEILHRTLNWVAAHRPKLDPSAWKAAVIASRVERNSADRFCMFSALQTLLNTIEDPMLILIDDVQFLLMPGEGVNSSDARFMRDVVLKQLLFNGPRSKIWAVTGSSMALFWQSLALMPTDSCSPLQGFHDLQLPASFPEAHMQAVGKKLGVPQEIVKDSPERPACLVTIAMDWTTENLPLSEASLYVQRWVDNRLIRESIVDWGRALPLLTAAQRVALRKLAAPEVGLACIGDIGEGLCRYLSPHCEKNAAGNLYLVPVEVRIALKVVIKQDGSPNLEWSSQSNQYFPYMAMEIKSSLQALGETVVNMDKKKSARRKQKRKLKA